MGKKKAKTRTKPTEAVRAPTKVPAGLLVAVAALALIAFLPALKNGFTHWDDNTYVTDNPLVASLSWGHIKTIFTTPHYGVYVPLAMVSYALERAAFGPGPAAPHAVNVALHAAVAALAFWLFFLLLGRNGPAAFAAAALFAVHPLRVESVAWISERKDLLCALFFVWALLAYARGGESGRRRLLVRTWFLFLAALLSKPMALSLPFVLLAMDGLATGRISRKAFREKIPFFALAVVFGFVALWANQPGDVPPGAAPAAGLIGALFQKAAIASFSIAFYVLKTLLPLKLSALYPYSGALSSLPPVLLLASPVILGLLAAAIVAGWRRSRRTAFGVMFFVMTLIPVLQLVALPGNTIVADRYAYIPGLGAAFLAGALLASESVRKNRTARIALAAAAAVLILAYSIATFARCRVWKDDRALWTDAAAKYPATAVAHDKLGLVYAGDGDAEAAVAEYGKAIALDGSYAGAYNNRAVALRRLKRYDEAAADYAQVIEINPSFADAHFNLGNLYRETGRNAEAVEAYGKALLKNPNSAPIYNNRALAYVALRDADKAQLDFAKALKIDPDYDAARFNRGILLVEIGRYRSALTDLDAAVKRNASIPNLYLARGLAYAGLGEYAAAMTELNEALRLKPDDPDALNQRIRVWLMMRDGASAAAEVARLRALGLAVDPALVRAADRLGDRK